MHHKRKTITVIFVSNTSIMRHLIIGIKIFFLLQILVSCTKETSQLNNTSVSPIVNSQIKGNIFKGGFLQGSLLFLYELDSSLNQTGKSFITTIDDNYGNFELKAQNINGKLVRVVGDGFYWNEVLDENSSTRISLTGICKVDSLNQVNVNVLTHLERLRVEFLYSKGLTFDSAKSQAVTEVLKAFGFENTGIRRSERVSVVGTGDDSKILLAISTLIQGYRTESEVTELMTDFANDIKTDGKLDDIKIGNNLENHLYYLDTLSILNAFKIRYKKIYSSNLVDPLNMSFIKKFQESTNYTRDAELIEFPEYEIVGQYRNILHPSVATLSNPLIMTINGQTRYSYYFGVAANLKRKGISIKVEIVNEDNSPVTPSENLSFNVGVAQQGWTIINNGNVNLTSNGLGLQTTGGIFARRKRYKVNIYEKGFSSPNRFKIITLE